MQIFCRNSVICLLVIFTPATVNAMKSMKQGDAVVTMRNGNPCFSYPQDKEIQKRPYSFGYLHVDKLGSIGGGGWVIQITRSDRKGLLDPNSPETCIEYGIHHPGTEDMEPAKPLQVDTPYEVRFVVYPIYSDGGGDERRYLSYFCVSRNENGESVLVSAEVNKQIGGFQCLKPGESPKRSLWQKLFGK
jgi:hypothetical protein